MLYKYLFSILCGHLNLNKKKLNLTGYQSNRPVYRPNRPVFRSNRSVPKCAGRFEFALGFNRFLSVSDETGPVYRNRSAPVWGVGWEKNCLVHFAKFCKDVNMAFGVLNEVYL